MKKLRVVLAILFAAAPITASASGEDRIDSPSETAKMFSKGASAISELKALGANRADTIDPKRLDMIYSLVANDIPNNVRRDSFGIHLKNSMSSGQQMRFEKRFGIRIAGMCNPASRPACYANVVSHKPLTTVMKKILSTDSSVASLNFNFVEN